MSVGRLLAAVLRKLQVGWGQSLLFGKPAVSGFLDKKTAGSGFPAGFLGNNLRLRIALITYIYHMSSIHKLPSKFTAATLFLSLSKPTFSYSISSFLFFQQNNGAG